MGHGSVYLSELHLHGAIVGHGVVERHANQAMGIDIVMEVEHLEHVMYSGHIPGHQDDAIDGSTAVDLT